MKDTEKFEKPYKGGKSFGTRGGAAFEYEKMTDEEVVELSAAGDRKSVV